MIYLKPKIKKSDLNNENGAISQWAVLIGFLVFVVGVFFISILLFSMAVNAIKTFADNACDWRGFLNVFLTGGTQEAFTAYCEDEGKTAPGEEYDDFESRAVCSGGESDERLDISAVISRVARYEGGEVDGKFYVYADPSRGTNIGYGHSLDLGNVANFETVVTDKKVSDLLAHNECKVPLAKSSQIDTCPYITKEQAKGVLEKDIASAEANAKSVVGVYDSLPGEAKAVVIEMYFQMGPGALAKYTRLIDALNNRNWTEAAAEILDSETYVQSGCGTREEGRANANLLREGTFYPSSANLCRTMDQAYRMIHLNDGDTINCNPPVVKASGDLVDYNNDPVFSLLDTDANGANYKLDPVFADALRGAVLDLKEAGIDVLIVSANDGDHTAGSAHYRGIAVDINASDNTGKKICMQRNTDFCPELIDGKNAVKGGCSPRVVSIMNRHGIVGVLCKKEVSGFSGKCGDCNHFALSKEVDTGSDY